MSIGLVAFVQVCVRVRAGRINDVLEKSRKILRQKNLAQGPDGETGAFSTLNSRSASL
jgi:hypothetical protein